MAIQWFPGHMAKTRRLITDNLKLVDIVIELIDARVPFASSNPLLKELSANKPKVVAINKCDLADDISTDKWIEYYKKCGITAIKVNCVTGAGFKELKAAVRNTLKEKIMREMAKGMKERAPKMMVVGIPNVGKSTFINKLSGRAGTKTGDRPGVTTCKQWIRIPGGYELLDTPGILWPKFDNDTIGYHLAFTGAIRDEVYDVEEVASLLCEYYRDNYKDIIMEKYKLSDISGMNGYDILTLVSKKRGCIVSGGEINTERGARILLDDFRSQKLGKITLELPERI